MGMRAGQLRNPWGQRSEDNIIQMKRESAARNFMQKRLESMTACLDTAPPKTVTMRHLELRLKKLQMADDRRQAIARDNRKLMEKMTAIIEGRGKKPIFTPPVLLTRPRNERIQRERVERVNHDNKAMVQRLRSQTGYISAAKMEEDYQKWLETRRNCSKAYKRAKRAKNMEKLRQTKHGQEQYSNQDPYHYQETGSKSIAIETSLGGVTGGVGTSTSSIGMTSIGGVTAVGQGGPVISVPFRTARQLKEGLQREGLGGFIPLPSLVQPPPLSSSSTPSLLLASSQSSDQDVSISKLGNIPIQYGIQHNGSSSSASASTHARSNSHSSENPLATVEVDDEHARLNDTVLPAHHLEGEGELEL